MSIANLIFENLLMDIARKYGLEIRREYRFHETYQYRFDYAIPSLKIAFEIEGGIFIYGRHNKPIGYTEDVIKYNLATAYGWSVYRFTTTMIRNNVFIYPTRQKPKREVVFLSHFLEKIIKDKIQAGG